MTTDTLKQAAQIVKTAARFGVCLKKEREEWFAIAAALEAMAEQKPVAHEVRAYDRCQELIVRADVADEKACKLREACGPEANVSVRPLYAAPITIPERQQVAQKTAAEIAHEALRISWWDTESAARRVAQHAEKLLAQASLATPEHDAQVCNAALEEAAQAVRNKTLYSGSTETEIAAAINRIRDLKTKGGAA